MSLCAYKDALGRPGAGVHRYRVLHMAGTDILLTLLVSFLLTFCFFRITDGRNFLIMFVVMSLFWFSAGIILHRAFCVRTTMDKWLFPRVHTLN